MDRAKKISDGGNIDGLRVPPGHLHHVFPGEYDRKRPMSENAINAALRRIGYPKEQFTGHGFRSMTSTLLNELGWDHDAIERQLAHVEGNKIKAAYNYAEHLPVRRKMMQAWSDHLDMLKAKNEASRRKASTGATQSVNSSQPHSALIQTP